VLNDSWLQLINTCIRCTCACCWQLEECTSVRESDSFCNYCRWIAWFSNII